jgi:hypothetical protein
METLGMLSLVPFILCATLGAYLLTREIRSIHTDAARPPTAVTPPVAATVHPVAATARQRRRAARNATDPNDAARLSGSWG